MFYFLHNIAIVMIQGIRALHYEELHILHLSETSWNTEVDELQISSTLQKIKTKYIFGVFNFDTYAMHQA